MRPSRKVESTADLVALSPEMGTESRRSQWREFAREPLALRILLLKSVNCGSVVKENKRKSNPDISLKLMSHK